MPRKTKIIFITVFAIVGVIMLSFYFYTHRSQKTTNTTTNGTYQPFFGGSTTLGQNTQTGEVPTGDNTNTSNPTTIPEEAQSVVGIDRFHQITDFPVAGATFFEDTRPVAVTDVALPGGELPPDQVPGAKTVKGKVVAPKPQLPKVEVVPAIRYVEKITGHIDEMYLDTKAVGKNSNSTIPSIYEAVFDGSASSILYRYLSSDGKTINTFLASLGGTKGEFLPADILDVSISPDKTKFFYLTKTFSGTVGTTRSFKDTKKNQVFNSSLTELLSQWVGLQTIYLTTKASATINGDLFSLNTVNGVLTKIFGGVQGLTTLANNDGSFVLYSATTNGNPRLGIFDVKKHATRDLGLYSLPEKCVWGNTTTFIYCAIPREISGGQFPDSWYQGLVSFTDHFVKINTTTGEISTIADSAYGIPVDGTHLFLNKTEDQLFFINKKDSSLWSLDLN